MPEGIKLGKFTREALDANLAAISLYLDELFAASGGSGAPADAEYIVGAGDGDLSAERVATDTATIDADMGTAGQAKWNVVDGSIGPTQLADIASDRLLGRDTAGSGDIESLTVGGGVEFTGAGGIQRSALSGDVAATAGSGTTTIGADKVLNTMLRDSAALSVIGRSANSSGDPADIAGATVGHVLQVLPGPTVGFAASTGNGPEGSAYHPDREPATGLDTSRSDNFNGAGQQTWTNVNSGPTSDTLQYDTATMAQATEARNARGRYVSGPGAISADFSIYTKLTCYLPGNFASAGMMLLANGSWAVPTSLVFNYLARDSGNGFGTVYHQTRTSFAGASTTIALFGSVNALIAGLPTYLWLRYTASTKVAACFTSWSGMPDSWTPLATSTLANHPDIARVVDSQGSAALTASFHWWRVFVSGTNSATAAQYSGGVCGS